MSSGAVSLGWLFLYLLLVDGAIVLVWPAGLSLITAQAPRGMAGLLVGTFYLPAFSRACGPWALSTGHWGRSASGWSMPGSRRPDWSCWRSLHRPCRGWRVSRAADRRFELRKRRKLLRRDFPISMRDRLRFGRLIKLGGVFFFPVGVGVLFTRGGVWTRLLGRACFRDPDNEKERVLRSALKSRCQSCGLGSSKPRLRP